MVVTKTVLVLSLCLVIADASLKNNIARNPVLQDGFPAAAETAGNMPSSLASFLAPGPASNSSQSLDMTSAAMEAAITDLMLGKSSFGATPMGGSVKKITNLLTKDMMPKVLAAHKADQKELKRLIAELKKCGSTKDSALRRANVELTKYKKGSRLHKSCRSDEAVKFTSKKNCLTKQRSLYQIKVLKCKQFSAVSAQLGTTKANRAVVTKAGSESVDSYIRRISVTICGRHVHGSKGRSSRKGGWGGGLANGFLDRYLRRKDACEKAIRNYNKKVKECRIKTHAYNVRKGQCNQYQTLMDAASCKRAVLAKDACESYAECYYSQLRAYKVVLHRVQIEEMDRKAEWRGLNRMSCLMTAFADGKVSNAEVDACKKRVVSTKLLIIKYPKIPPLAKCATPQLYPSTGAYKRAEYAPLPSLAKGLQSVECSGVQEISTKPARGSPKSCKCRRVTLNGFYSAGPMVACKKCRDVRRSRDRNSCPKGTKVFSPATRADWKTFISSASPLRAPHWIIDVTRPQNSCGGCTKNAMNSGNNKQKSWRTSDGSPWWLRSTRYNEPNGDYAANCYLDLWHKPRNENSVTFNDGRCNYHAKSYYCQPIDLSMKPRKGSPRSCNCKKVELTGGYSAGLLVRCDQCTTVYRSSQRNSCPAGMKLFSPRTRRDWKTFISSTPALRAPHFIIDVTRPQNGCGGCTRYAMKSTTPQQASWRTSDRSPWWLRSSRYNEPNGDYSANCFLDLWRTPHNSENNIQFNDGRCNYRSRSYYCQPVMAKPKPRPPPPPPPAPKKVKSGNFYYATLDNVAATARYNTDRGLSDKSCHRRQYARAVPSGWELAPYNRAILNYPWSTHCLIFSNGKSYGGGAYGRGRGCGNNQLVKRGNKYHARSCSRRVVIRKQITPSKALKVGGYFYKTLDNVNPHAGYGKDRGLSHSSCHYKKYARAIPAGWQLAPYNRAILNYPWSTHCLIFNNGRTYGTKTYGINRNCGGPYLGKTGNRYYAKYCSRRVVIRQKAQ